MPRYRHLKRYRQIANSLVRHGFGHLLDQLNISHLFPAGRRKNIGDAVTHLSGAQRLRTLLEELGPTFVKFGQLLSTRPDLMPREYLEELSRLQDNVPPFSFSDVQATVSGELKRPLEEIFTSFEQEPLAAASISQVHRAVLQDGTPVVVKVRRPGIRRQMEIDLEILLEAAALAERHTSWGKLYRVKDVVLELQKTVREELDFQNEAENAEAFRNNFIDRTDVYIPRVYKELSSPAVLTMEMVEGIKLNSPESLRKAGFDPGTIVHRLVDTMFEQVFVFGLFHGDPHPGNLALDKQGRLVFLDFGIVGRLQGERKHRFITFLLGVINSNSRQIVRSLSEMGILSAHVDRRALLNDVEKLLSSYLDVPLRKIKLGKALAEIFALTYNYKILLPAEFTLLAKSIMTLEGVIEELDASFKLTELLKPYAPRLLRERYSPKVLKNTAVEQFYEVSGFIKSLPQRLNELMDRVDTDGFPVHHEFPDKDKAFAHLDRLINRLTFSIVLLAFSIIVAGLVIGSGLVATASGEQLLWRLPIIEIGFVIAVLMAAWLLLAIYRSGKL